MNPRNALPRIPFDPWASIPPSCIHLSWSTGGVPLLLRILVANNHRLSDAPTPSSDHFSQQFVPPPPLWPTPVEPGTRSVNPPPLSHPPIFRLLMTSLLVNPHICFASVVTLLSLLSPSEWAPGSGD